MNSANRYNWTTIMTHVPYCNRKPYSFTHPTRYITARIIVHASRFIYLEYTELLRSCNIYRANKLLHVIRIVISINNNAISFLHFFFHSFLF